ncbi:MAG: hypothetical protein MUC77_05125 [Chromatiaceae bacterium]|jgi:hypothetical protein|nr:hypothetical protein [Chromatiaceae bacterium]
MGPKNMASTALREEVDTFREYMKELSYRAMRTDMAVARLSDEMRDFKDEMRQFKDEMGRFRDKSDRKRMNKQWGEVASRLGTLVEDTVAPNLPRVAAELFACPLPDFFAVRVRRRFDGETREYDALLACPRVVLVNETKSQLREGHVDDILAKLAELPRVCPEYADRRLVGVLATLYPEPGVVRRATAQGILVMGMGDETMQVLNPESVTAET